MSRSKGVYIEPEAERIHMFTENSFSHQKIAQSTSTKNTALGNYGASLNSSLVKSP